MKTDNYSNDSAVNAHSNKIGALITLMNKTGIQFNTTPICFEWEEDNPKMVCVVDSGGYQIGTITLELYEKLGN